MQSHIVPFTVVAVLCQLLFPVITTIAFLGEGSPDVARGVGEEILPDGVGEVVDNAALRLLVKQPLGRPQRQQIGCGELAGISRRGGHGGQQMQLGPH